MEELKYFFSYARIDSEFVLQLAKELRAVGANLWLDQLDILGGQHWDSTVEQALKCCKGMIAVLSPESVASENVMDEVAYALDEGKLVVPVLIRACDIPLRLRRLQYIDFTADYETGFSQLVRALGIEQPAQPVEPAAAPKPVVQDSTAPLEAEPTEPLVHEEQAAQEVEEPSPPEGSESTPDTPDHSKPTGVETEKAPSMSQKTKVLAAICIVALIAIISTVFFLNYFKTYRLTVEAVDGSVAKDPNQASYKHGAKVTLTAVPEPNYRFAGWSGDLSDSNNPATLIVDANMSVTAHFALKTYGLDIPHAVGGSVMKDPNQASYEHGAKVTLTAVPEPGYNFTNWSGALSGSTNPATLVVDANMSVTANFVPNSEVTPLGFYIHKGCEPFKDEEEDVKRGPITFIRVLHGDYIYGLRLRYASKDGVPFGLENPEYGVPVAEWSVPDGEQIVRVKGEIAKYGSDFLYVSRLQFITDKETLSPPFGGNPGTPFVAEDENGLPLRTISGWANLRQHPSLKRAITSMTFYFGN